MSIALSSNQDAVNTWLASSLGQYLQAQEQVLFEQAVVDLFGFNALQMGYSHMALLSNSRIANRYVATDSLDLPSSTPQFYCCDDFLPIADNSLDLLLLPHRLEFSERPHQTLREAARVMMPEGHLLISGFNHLSLWGAAACFKKALSKNPNYPWSGQFIGLTRLKDWLALLSFEVVSVQMCCYLPPFEKLSWRQRFACFDRLSQRVAMLGGVYFIVAKKRVAGMTPIKPNWKLSPLKCHLIVSPTPSKPSQKPSQKALLKMRNRKTNKHH